MRMNLSHMVEFIFVCPNVWIKFLLDFQIDSENITLSEFVLMVCQFIEKIII